ncbi:hypothetical protein ACSAMQ_20595, partial [Lysobacter sp. 1R34A]
EQPLGRGDVADRGPGGVDRAGAPAGRLGPVDGRQHHHRDADGYRTALKRAESWVRRLSPPSPAQDRQLAQLRELAALPLSLSVPTLGTTLQQLRQLRTAQ